MHSPALAFSHASAVVEPPTVYSAPLLLGPLVETGQLAPYDRDLEQLPAGCWRVAGSISLSPPRGAALTAGQRRSARALASTARALASTSGFEQ